MEEHSDIQGRVIIAGGASDRASRLAYFKKVFSIFIILLSLGIVTVLFTKGIPWARHYATGWLLDVGDVLGFISQAILAIYALYAVFALIDWKIRRIHDIGLSGWWFIPLGAPIFEPVLVFWPGTRGPNRFGPDPLAPVPAAPSPIVK